MENKFDNLKWRSDQKDQITEHEAFARHILSHLVSIKNGKCTAEAMKLLMENLPVGVFVFHKGQYIYVNPAFEKLLGFTREEIIGKNLWDFVHPDHREMVKTRGLARLRGEHVPTNYVVKSFKKNGDLRWLDLYFTLASVEGDNISVAVFIDITESVQLREELQITRCKLEDRVKQRTEELNRLNKDLNFLNQSLNNILRNLANGVVTVNRSGDFEIMNNPFFSTKDEKINSEIKAKLKEHFLKDESDSIRCMVERKESFRDKEIKLKTSRGPINFLISGTPILGEEGAFNRGVIIFRPIKDVHRLVNRISGANAMFRCEDIITDTQDMLELIKKIKISAPHMSNVLITGESGTGKELFAQAIHNESSRCKGPFLAVNCGAIPRELIGSELFGYAEGAFTGAKKGGNPGKFELAAGGTLFLDEIGDMPLEQQVALLRVLQEKSVTRIGGNEEITIDVRIICATNKELSIEMNKGSFRKDLYYRLNVINFKIPPLRERRDDIPLLFMYFLKMITSQLNIKIENINQGIFDYLKQYDWPGNVRELQNIVERMISNMQGCSLEVDHLPSEIKELSFAISNPAIPKISQVHPITNIGEFRAQGRKIIIDAEKNEIARLLQESGGNVSKVAKIKGVARSTIYKKMRAY